MKKGFTLIEILIAVLIMGVLVAMAAPMYERTVEKSRIAEARTMLKRIYDAKRRVLDNQEQTTYSASLFGFENLDFTLPCPNGTTSSGGHQVTCSSKDFKFVLNPTGAANAVCAVRRSGDNAGVNFLYRGEEVAATSEKFLCHNGGVTNGCDHFGMDATSGSAWCSN